jgi:hypothetical protein
VCGVLVGLFLVALAAPILFRKPSNWATVYVPAGERLRSGQDIYEWKEPIYAYPPFGALLAVPAVDLTPAAGRVVWLAVNVAAALVLLGGAWRLTGGAGLPGAPGTGRADAAAFGLGTACAAGFLLDVTSNWQTDLLVAALLVGGCGLLVRGRSVAAGVLFGLAAALKCTPLLFAPYLLWKRRRAGAAAVVAVAVGASYLPDALYPPPDGQPRLERWAERYLGTVARADVDPGVWASEVGYNHSLAGVLNRWLTVDRIEIDGWSGGVPRADRPTTAALKRLVWGVEAGLVLLAVAALWRKPADTGATRAAEFGIVLTLMLLLSPMSSKPHFCTLLLPQLLLARLGWERRDRLLIGLTAIAAVLGLLANKDAVGRRAYDVLVWNGAVFGNALLLFVGCCYARWRYAASPERVTVFTARVALPTEPDRLERSGERVEAATPRAAAGQPIRVRNSSNR